MGNNVIKRLWNKNTLTNIEDLRGMTFQAEEAGHTFEIRGVDGDGNTIALSGTPAGVMLRPDNTDVALTCAVSDGVVTATLPAECYDVPGRFGLTVYLTSDGQKTAIYAAIGSVARTSSGNVSPATTASVVDLINAIEAAIEQIPASDTNLKAALAPTYSTSAVYAVGSYAWYDGKLYRCITAITNGETWNSAHWTEAKVGQDVCDLKSAINGIASKHIRTEITEVSNKVSNGMTFNKVSNGLSISGSSTASGIRYYEIFNNIYANPSSSQAVSKILAPGTYIAYLKIVQNAPSKEVMLICADTTYGASNLKLRDGDIFTISSASSLAFRISSGTQFGTVENPTIIDAYVRSISGESPLQYTNRIYQSVDNWITGNYHKNDGSYGDWTKAICTKEAYIPNKNCKMFLVAPSDACVSVSEYNESGIFITQYGSHNPGNNETTKEVELTETAGYQYMISLGTYPNDDASSKLTQSYLDNLYVYTNINDSIYDIESTGTSEDRTVEVKRILNQKGACKFGPGRFNIKGLFIPDGSMIEGCGEKTEIRLPDSEESNLWTFGDISFTQEVIKEFGAQKPAGLYYIKADVSSTDTDASTCRISLFKGSPYTSSNRVVDLQIARGEGVDGYFYAQEPFVAVGLIASNTYANGAGDTAVFDNVEFYEEETALILNSNCTIKNLLVSGSSNEIEIGSTIGHRHGIGYYGIGQDTTKKRGIIDGCFIRSFSAGGITPYNTGYGTQGLIISNCYVYNCYAGFNGFHWTEFHRVTGCSFVNNYIGVLNNGGNNQFTGCNITANSYGYMTDDESDTHPNGTHGGCCGCIMQHNTVRAIYIYRGVSGFIFDGCNIDDGGVYLNSSTRIIFNACNFSKHFSIHIFNCSFVLFSSCNMRELLPEVEENDPHEKVNSVVKFVNCFDYRGNEMDPFEE